MKKEIFINASDNQQRIAIVEDGKLAELFIENDDKERMVGDIYIGTVAKMMPGIQASFIDIGLSQDAFLHFSDVGDEFREVFAITGDNDGIETRDDEDAKGDRRKRRRGHPPSRVQLQKGQEVIVQIFKEPVANKGVRATTEVSLAGRFLVLLPYGGKIGVSRKIFSFKEKRRLRTLARSILPAGFGAIIRTVAEGKAEEVVRADLEGLLQTWREVEMNIKKSGPPARVYKDMNTSSSTIRDLFSDNVVRLAVDSKKIYRETRAYLNLVDPGKVDVLELHDTREPIFDLYEIEKQIQQSMNRRVWLKSGGYLIIEHTEAMKVVDVNSGRYAGKRDQEQNSLKTNLEAAKEIARQIRLRDLAGIIVIDFIDMLHEENRRKLFDEMRREMRPDRAKFTILPVTEFGLIQITRQRIRDSVQMSVSETCPTCAGFGRVMSKASLLTQIERWIRRFRGSTRELRLALHVHPVMAEFLTEGTFSQLSRLMLKYFIRIRIVSDPAMQVDEFRMVSRKRNRDITKNYLSARTESKTS